MADAPYSAAETALREKLQKGYQYKGPQLRPPPPKTCKFDVSACLPPDFWTDTPLPSADMFTHLAFVHPACGDCLIDALVAASGSKGLSAFLPPADKTYLPAERAAQMWDREEPMLPLTPTWEEADFSLAHNVRLGQDRWARNEPKDQADGVNLLDWSVKLLSRYAYVYAKTPSRFAMIHSIYQLHTVLKGMKQSTHDYALACLNDDQPDVPKRHIRVQLQRWMRERFGGLSRFVGWEREGVAWDVED